MTETFTLVMLFDDLTVDEHYVVNRTHAKDIVRMEGDHVWDWYIKEDLVTYEQNLDLL